MNRKLNLEKLTKTFLFKEWHCHLVKCVRGRLFSFQSRTGKSPWLGLPRSNNYTSPSAFFKFYFHGNIPFTDLLPFAPETPFYPLFFLVVKSLCNRLKRQGAEGRVSPLDPSNPFSVESPQFLSDLPHPMADLIYVWHVWKLSQVWKSFFKKNEAVETT